MLGPGRGYEPLGERLVGKQHPDRRIDQQLNGKRGDAFFGFGRALGVKLGTDVLVVRPDRVLYARGDEKRHRGVPRFVLSQELFARLRVEADHFLLDTEEFVRVLRIREFAQRHGLPCGLFQ